MPDELSTFNNIIANGIAIYLNEIYSKDLRMKKILEKFYDEYPLCAFSN